MAGIGNNYGNATFLPDLDICALNSSSVTASFAIFIVNILMIIVLCKLLHLFLGPLGQPRIISDFIVGLLVGNIPSLLSGIDGPVVQAFRRLEVFATSSYMFALGLEMEPVSILHLPGPEAIIAYAGILTTSMITFGTYTFFNQRGLGLTLQSSPRVVALLAIVLSATSSTIVTRLVTQLKIGKSEIGRLAIRASLHTDMVCTILLGTLMILRNLRENPSHALGVIVFLFLEVIFINKAVKPFFEWLNHRNPEGKPMRGVDMTAALATVGALCFSALPVDYDPKMNAFLVGLLLTREGRVANFLISKMNYALTEFILPLYLSSAGFKVNLQMWNQEVDVNGRVTGGHALKSWYRVSIVGTVATIGKLSGTLFAGMYIGLHWLEAITIGILLNIKGYFHFFVTFQARNVKFMSDSGVLVLLTVVLASIVFVTPVVALIVQHVRVKKGNLKMMGLQYQNPASELRIILGLHGPHNVPAAANLIETMRGASAGGLSVFVVDMIEMTDKAAATLMYGHGTGTVMVSDESIVEKREQIGLALDAYIEESGDAGLQLRRSLAISSFADMHEDICGTAEDTLSAIIVLPYHKTQKVDGGMDSGHPGYRLVNKRVMEAASCSVGILVDRGVGQANTSVSIAAQNVAVLFIGGADDREALAYAACIVQHPAVRLMAIRLIVETRVTTADVGNGRGRRILMAMAQTERSEAEMMVDDEYFTRFYENYIASGAVGYMERHVANGMEAVAALRAVEGEYQLFVVGRGKERDSALTAGMTEWAECPELGALGDILASSDFTTTASVLVIQQHDPSRDMNLVSDEFKPL